MNTGTDTSHRSRTSRPATRSRKMAITERDVYRILDESDLGLPDYYRVADTRSGCYFCFFQRKAEWLGLKDNHPQLFNRRDRSTRRQIPKPAVASRGPRSESLRRACRVPNARRRDSAPTPQGRAKRRKPSQPDRPLIEVLADSLRSGRRRTRLSDLPSLNGHVREMTAAGAHKTAIQRWALSRPDCRLPSTMACSRRQTTFFDYGCGRGGDLKRLHKMGVPCGRLGPRLSSPMKNATPADVVNLGYVVNVIEDLEERTVALCAAWELAQKLLIVCSATRMGGTNRRWRLPRRRHHHPQADVPEVLHAG